MRLVEDGHVRDGSERVVGITLDGSFIYFFYGFVVQLPWASARGGLKMT